MSSVNSTTSVNPKSTQPLLFERLHYRAPYGHVTVMARFNRQIAADQLKKLLPKLTEKYPLMGAYIEQQADGSAYFVLRPNPDYKIIVKQKVSDEQWLTLTLEEQKKPFSLNQGPLIRFFTLNSPNETDLVILCHHTICDGLSLTYLIKDLTLLLNYPNHTLEPQSIPPTVSENNFTVKVSTGFVPKLFLKHLNSEWKKDNRTFNQTEYELIHSAYWKENKVRIKMLTIPKSVTSSLITYCHNEKISVNSLLVTAFALAQNEVEGNLSSFLGKVEIAINIRHLLKVPSSEAFGLLAAGNSIPVKRMAAEDFLYVAKRVNIETKRILANPKKVLQMLAFNQLDPTLLDATWFAAYGKFENKTALRLKKMFISRSDRPERKIGVTNLGNVNIDLNEPVVVQSLYFVPPYWANSEKVIGVVTAAGSINISILYDSRYIPNDIMERFTDLVLRHLKEAIIQ